MVRENSENRMHSLPLIGRHLTRAAVRLIGCVSFVRAPKRRRFFWRNSEAAELVEFALLLPMLLVMIIGILDFATAYNLKQKLANAAREGARLGSSQTTADWSQTNPPSVGVIKDDVTTYLQQAGVDTSFIGTTMNPGTNFTWTYYSSGTYGLKIEHNVQILASGTSLQATRVTLNCPYDWTYGFNHIIKLLIPSSTGIANIGIQTDATMVNLAP